MSAAPTTDGLAGMLQALHDTSPQLVALFDAQDVLRYANTAFRQAFDTQPDGHTRWAGMMRANHASGRGSVVSTNAAGFEPWLASALSRRGTLPFRAFEADLCDGRWIWMTETVHANGWMLCVASDITGLRQDGRALRQAHDRALRASQTDALTGLSNRRHLLQQMEHALAQVNAGGGPLCVVALDLDHFKRINDSLGHAAGDLVICHFARHLQASTRRGDGCGRMGGEEFMLLLPGVALEQAGAIVLRLLERVRQARPMPQAPKRGYTTSAGLALAQAGDSVADLFRRADEALYCAKTAGRDRLALAPLTPHAEPTMHSPPVKYLILIEASGAMTARLFDADRRHLSDMDAATEEVPDLIAGITPEHGANAREWGSSLVGHSPEELRQALVYALPV